MGFEALLMPTPTVFATDGFDIHPDWTARQHLTLLKQQAFRVREAYREAHQIWMAPEHDRFGRYMARDRVGHLIIPTLVTGSCRDRALCTIGVRLSQIDCNGGLAPAGPFHLPLKPAPGVYFGNHRNGGQDEIRLDNAQPLAHSSRNESSSPITRPSRGTGRNRKSQSPDPGTSPGCRRSALGKACGGHSCTHPGDPSSAGGPGALAEA